MYFGRRQSGGRAQDKPVQRSCALSIGTDGCRHGGGVRHRCIPWRHVCVHVCVACGVCARCCVWACAVCAREAHSIYDARRRRGRVGRRARESKRRDRSSQFPEATLRSLDTAGIQSPLSHSPQMKLRAALVLLVCLLGTQLVDASPTPPSPATPEAGLDRGAYTLMANILNGLDGGAFIVMACTVVA